MSSLLDLPLIVRNAKESDADDICRILAVYADEHLLLRRSKEDILEKIANFRVGTVDGRFACCLALRDYGDSLFEIRSLAVDKEFINHRLGSALVRGAVEDLRRRKIPCRVFALTYRAHFFENLGFRIVSKELFPQKIWSDCSVCAKKDCCDETAVLLDMTGAEQ